MELPTPQTIESLAHDAGLPMKAACALAGIAHSTFIRWKGGRNSPTIENVQRLLDAIAARRENGTDAPAVKRGRPKGNKNKPKT
jgi:predicted transcriptional regulator